MEFPLLPRDFVSIVRRSEQLRDTSPTAPFLPSRPLLVPRRLARLKHHPLPDFRVIVVLHDLGASEIVPHLHRLDKPRPLFAEQAAKPLVAHSVASRSRRGGADPPVDDTAGAPWAAHGQAGPAPLDSVYFVASHRYDLPGLRWGSM